MREIVDAGLAEHRRSADEKRRVLHEVGARRRDLESRHGRYPGNPVADARADRERQMEAVLVRGTGRVTVVADANLLAALVVPTDHSAAAEARFAAWIDEGSEVYSPALWWYEAASAVRKHVRAREIAETKLRRSSARSPLCRSTPCRPTPTCSPPPRTGQLAWINP